MSHTDTAVEQGPYDAHELIGQLHEQCALSEALVALAEHQRSLVAADETERLLEVLGQRQKLIDRLGVLADRLHGYQEDWDRIRARMGEADGQEVDRLVSRVQGSLAVILERDKADAERLAARKRQAVAALADVRMSKVAGAAYAAAGDTGQSRVDWTDE